MPTVSVNILTKNRAALLQEALLSVENQTFADYEVIVVNDGSADGTEETLQESKIKNLHIITHRESQGITKSRQEALMASRGEFIALLDDDDEWVDADKLKKQVEYFNAHPEAAVVGGARYVFNPHKLNHGRLPLITRPEQDEKIRQTMLLKNNFFTSTVMFRRSLAIAAGGFRFDGDDFTEDYDLWLRMGKKGKMYNFQVPFDKYRLPSYNKERFLGFLRKQLRLIVQHKHDYPHYSMAAFILKIRILIGR